MNQMKSPGKFRRNEFATSELPSVLMVKLFDETLTAELPETMVNCSPSLSPTMVWLVVLVCRKGRTFTIGATEMTGATRECTEMTGPTDTVALISGTVRGLTPASASGVTTV